jgi:hypothetical protein
VRAGVSFLAPQARARAPLHLIPPSVPARRRPAALPQARFVTLDARCQAVAPGHRCRLKRPLCSLDSPTISRCLRLFPWARYRRAKGALKCHPRLDHAGHIPAWLGLTAGKRSDLAVARGRQLPRGSLAALDRGYSDDGFLFRLTQGGGDCVTRQKINARLKVTARLEVDGPRGRTSDHNVILLGQKAHPYPAVPRRGGTGTRKPASMTCSGPMPAI